MFQGLKFAHTREDPNVEIRTIQSIYTEPLRIALICSGGCTILSLLASLPFTKCQFHIVDANPSQLDLFHMKYDLLYESLHNSLVQSRQTWSQVRNLYRVFARVLDTRASYEQVFRELRQSGFDLEHVFSEENLMKHFGSGAVEHSRQTKFSQHMEEVLKSTSSYFRDLILYGTFRELDVPLFLTDGGLDNLSRLPSFEALTKNKEKDTRCLFLYAMNMINFLTQALEKKERFHFIQLSNITDWMSMKDRQQLLQLAWDCLLPNGKLLVRRFNGDYDLVALLKRFGFETKMEHDQSAFYSEVVVATKSIKLSKL